MGHLVSEIRVNKNGVPVKKYVRADGKGKRQPNPLPPPSPTDEFSLQCKKLTSLVENELYEGEYEHTNIAIPANISQYIAKRYSPATVAAYVKADEETPDDHYPALLLGVLSNRDDDHKAAYMLALAKLDNQKDYEWDDSSKGPYTYTIATQIYNGLFSPEYRENVGFNPTDNILDEDDPEAKKVYALVSFTQRLYEQYDIADALFVETSPPTAYIENDDLVRLVLERPEDEEKIAEIAIEEQVWHADVIRAMMDAPVQSLRDGAL